MMTGDRLARNGSIITDVCRFCDTGAVENHQHMWWECPAWAHIRVGFPLIMDEVRDEWPKCLLTCGLMPIGFVPAPQGRGRHHAPAAAVAPPAARAAGVRVLR